MTKQEQFHEIMQEFDFEKVHAYMKTANWTWADTSNGENTVPGVFDLIETAEELLTDVIFNDAPLSSTGGFMAYKNGDDYGLAFCIEEVETWVKGF